VKASPLTSPTNVTKQVKEVIPKSVVGKVNIHISTRNIDSKDTERLKESGAHVDLLQLYQNGKISAPQSSLLSANTGQFIQRIAPKKKKFSSLKKKVLEERLRKWQEANGIIPENDTTQSSESTKTGGTTTVCLSGFAYEIDDDDECEELVNNLCDMASKIGKVRHVFIPRTNEGSMHWPAFVDFGNDTKDDATSDVPRKPHGSDAITAANAAVQCWNALVLGGQTVSCHLLPIEQRDTETTESDATDPSMNVPNDDKEILWRNQCLAMESARTKSVVDPISSEERIQSSIRSEVLLNNILTDDDINDADCLEESLNDIRRLASKYGEIKSVIALRTEDDALSTHVLLTYSCDASAAILELNRVIFGGQPIVATLTSLSTSKSTFAVRIHNIITDDDLEDECCLEESLNDVKELATQFGQVQSIAVDRPDDPSKLSDCNEYAIKIYFPTIDEAQDAMKGFNGMLIGGQTVTATVDGSNTDTVKLPNEADATGKCNNGPSPMYSGDKLISERFAECKRVPKILNQSVDPRPYAKLVSDAEIKPKIIEMLSELMRLQRRAMEENNTKAKRRLVMGLREVARGIRSHKVKLVIMANNLDEYGAIDKTVQDIIDLARNEEVPIYYELNKRSLGKAVGKSIKVAVVGVQNADGAHQQYKALMNYAAKHFY
jgi:selenocysteine insertion sequence-binding protein 2